MEGCKFGGAHDSTRGRVGAIEVGRGAELNGRVAILTGGTGGDGSRGCLKVSESSSRCNDSTAPLGEKVRSACGEPTELSGDDIGEGGITSTSMSLSEAPFGKLYACNSISSRCGLSFIKCRPVRHFLMISGSSSSPSCPSSSSSSDSSSMAARVAAARVGRLALLRSNARGFDVAGLPEPSRRARLLVTPSSCRLIIFMAFNEEVFSRDLCCHRRVSCKTEGSRSMTRAILSLAFEYRKNCQFCGSRKAR